VLLLQRDAWSQTRLPLAPLQHVGARHGRSPAERHCVQREVFNENPKGLNKRFDSLGYYADLAHFRVAGGLLFRL
jgi:Mlc titration factor MtfA (ptsG expression regulator)